MRKKKFTRGCFQFAARKFSLNRNDFPKGERGEEKENQNINTFMNYYSCVKEMSNADVCR